MEHLEETNILVLEFEGLQYMVDTGSTKMLVTWIFVKHDILESSYI